MREKEMPKRVGYLYEEIYQWHNLLLAFSKARKAKRHKKEVAEFEYNLENELIAIEDKLENQSYQFGAYRHFKIFEPKERLISCAPFRDRVVHHAICNIVAPHLDKTMLPDTFACRKNKGLHHAVRRAFYMYKNSAYVYKFDICKYFYTIDHAILLSKIKRKIKDPKLLHLLSQLLETYSTTDEYYFPLKHDTDFDKNRKRGLPIGNLTSQIFANFYLSEFDHFIKENLKMRYYIRYMDDILIFSDDKQQLTQVKEIAETELAKIRLKIHPDKNQIHKTANGVNFLGFRFKGNQIKVGNQNLHRFQRKMKEKLEEKDELDEILRSFNGHIGYLQTGNTHQIMEKILAAIPFQRNDMICRLTTERQ
jgi:retron-type reverse transcriptase